MHGPGDGIGLVRPAQPDHQRTSRVQRNRSVFRREDLISARPRGCFVYESLELWKRPALHGSPERNFSGCAVCENIERRLVEKAPHPQREALTSAWILERWVLSCQGHGLVCLRAIADADVNGPGLRGWAEGPRAHEPSSLDRRASNVVHRGQLRKVGEWERPGTPIRLWPHRARVCPCGAMLERAAAYQVKAEAVNTECLFSAPRIAGLLCLLPSQPSEHRVMVDRSPHGACHEPAFSRGKFSRPRGSATVVADQRKREPRPTVSLPPGPQREHPLQI